MGTAGQVFRFAAADFQVIYPHAGVTPVLAERVLEPGTDPGFSFVDLVRLPPGSAIAAHQHAENSEEVYVVLAGRGRICLEGIETEIGPGEVALNPPGGTHSLTNVGDSDLDFVVLEVAVPDPAPTRAPGER